jgi:uncharacterized membrane protein YccC
MFPESLERMSKKLEKRASRLARKAESRALAIRQVVGEYRDATRMSKGAEGVWQVEEEHREIERAVGRYNDVHRALRRIRKKIRLKSEDSARPTVRAFSGRWKQ